MSANSYLEYFLVFLGWILNNAIWDIILGTGLFALPLVFKIGGIWLKVREEGDDEGNKGTLALPRIEHAIYMAFLVIMFCALPLHPVDVNAMNFDKARSTECGVNIPAPEKTGYAAFINDFNGKTAHIPIWWVLVHKLSKGITQAAVASIPCGENLRQLRFEVQHTKIKDPILLEEVQEFANQCYSKAYYRLKVTSTHIPEDLVNIVGWIGSDFFLNTKNYYDYYTSMTPRSRWPYIESRDSGYPDVGRGGYPTCKEWWSDPQIGLKDRVLGSFNKNTKHLLQKKYGDEWEVLALRWVASPRNSMISGSGESYMRGNNASSGTFSFVSRGLSNIGIAAKQVTALPGFDALKVALPIVQALIFMLLIIIIPLLITFSAYDPKTVITISFAIFALIFVSFWWELAGWLDDRLVRILYNSLSSKEDSGISLTRFFSSTMDGWIMNLVLGAMYLAFPAVWLGALSMAGIKVGQIFSSALAGAARGNQQAGEKGSQLGASAVSGAFSKGKG